MGDEQHQELIEAAYVEHCNALDAVFGITATVIERRGRDYCELPGPPTDNGLRLAAELDEGIVLEAHEWTREHHAAGLSAPRPEGVGGWIVHLYRWEPVDIGSSRGIELQLCSAIPTYPWCIKGDDRSAQGLIDAVDAAFVRAAAAA